MAADGPRIIDFGIARSVDASTAITTTGAVVGTLAYMSPEQIRGEVAGSASDVFSLGSVLGFAATGRPPFGSDSAVSIMFRVVNQSPDLAGVADAKLRELIAGCLAKSPRDRPPVRVILAALGSEVPVPTAASALEARYRSLPVTACRRKPGRRCRREQGRMARLPPLLPLIVRVRREPEWHGPERRRKRQEPTR